MTPRMTLLIRSDRTLGARSRVSAHARAAACPPHGVHGFTIVELLVVIAIIAVLIGLLLPAVQTAREAARRTQCTNNMKQLGLAALTHTELRGHMPAQSFGAATVGSGCGPGLTSWLVPLLPFMEQTAIFDSMDHSRGIMDGCSNYNTLASPDTLRISASNPNAPAAGTAVASLLCPSDPWSMDPRYDAVLGNGRPAPGSYAGNGGWPWRTFGIPDSEYGLSPDGLRARNGAIGSSNARGVTATAGTWHREKIRPADFTDGMSHTALAAERRIAPYIELGPFPDQADYDRIPSSLRAGCASSSNSSRWLGPLAAAFGPNLRSILGSESPNETYARLIGRAWASGHVSFANVYTHVIEPNGVSGHFTSSNFSEPLGNYVGTASSQHAGGANVCFADGHVEFIRDSVELRVWWSMGSRNGGESFR